MSFILVGFNRLSAQEETDLGIEFTEIDSVQYIKFRSNYSSHLIVDSSKTANSFTLEVKGEVESFNNLDDNDRYYYKGFLRPLNSYVLNHCSKYICENFLLNKDTGDRQLLYSPYDNECETPVLSVDESKMLVFATDVFDTGSFISLYQRTEDGGEFNYQSFESWTTSSWNISEVVWIDNTSIALRTFDKYGGKTGNELLNPRYFKAELK